MIKLYTIAKALLYSLLLLAGPSIYAQDRPPILNAAKPQKGIYRDFQEFLDNAPSIQSPFQVTCLSDENKIERGTADYKLLLLDSLTKRRETIKTIQLQDVVITASRIKEDISKSPVSIEKLSLSVIQRLGLWFSSAGKVPITGNLF